MATRAFDNFLQRLPLALDARAIGAQNQSAIIAGRLDLPDAALPRIHSRFFSVINCVRMRIAFRGREALPDIQRSDSNIGPEPAIMRATSWFSVSCFAT